MRAPLLFVPQGTRPSPAAARGRILVREAVGGALPVDVLSASVLGVIDRDGTLDALLTPGARLERIWLRGSIPGDLLDAEQAGAAGVIFIRPFADETLEGLWVQTALSTIPAIQLGHTSGAALLDALDAPGEAQGTLTMTGVDTAVTARSVRVELPGRDPGRVVFVSHTDTLNAVQENGGVSLLALARVFAAVPARCRARTVRFEFAAGHRAGLVGSRAARAALEADGHPTLIIGLEHLGSLEYAPVDGPDGAVFEPTGRSELLALSLPHAELRSRHRRRAGGSIGC